MVTEKNFKVLEVLSFYLFSKGKKEKCNEAFRGVYNWRIVEKTLSQISYL